MELHGFVDAGGKAWGVVVYLRYPTKNNTSKQSAKNKTENADPYESKLILAASQVTASKNPLSVPRRELSALVLGVEKLLALAKELGMTKKQCTLHTDSVVCMYWVEKIF